MTGSRIHVIGTHARAVLALVIVLALSMACASVAVAEEAARVSYLGPEGTYTEEAAQFFFADGVSLNPGRP